MCCRWNENRETHESTIKGTNGGKATFFGSGGKDLKHDVVDSQPSDEAHQFHEAPRVWQVKHQIVDDLPRLAGQGRPRDCT
jgi:hypothetical protein